VTPVTKAGRFGRYARLTMYLNIVLSPAMTFGLVGMNVRMADAALIGGLNIGQTVICVLLVRAGSGHYLGERAQPRWWIAIATAFTAAGIGAAALAGSGQTPGLATGAAMVLSMSFVAALSTAVRLRWSIAAAAACCGLVWVLARDPVALLTVALLLGVSLLAYRGTLLTMRAVRQLDRARQVEAALAVAEERLRFSRDLHDVVGRTLSVVALKAELAAQLAKRGRGEAVDEMLEVRRIAQDSLAEMRAVVGGYRAADLGSELAGARALLASAGITCHVDRVGDLPDPVQGPLGWVVREGTTNLLRHSEARNCRLAITVGADAVTLSMENDGVTGPGAGAVRFGGGLVGLSERIAGVGGALRAERVAPDGFRLVVAVPLP
jgi:two-component system sensor histidine kinase DesK